MQATAACPVCDWKIETPVAVKTPAGVVTVCCEECAQALRDKADRPAQTERRHD